MSEILDSLNEATWLLNKVSFKDNFAILDEVVTIHVPG